MFRATKTAVAALLALAIAALPLVLDRCAESCELHAIASTPACHHATSTGPHIKQLPTPCGHDHKGTTVAAAQGAAPTGRAFASIIAVGSHQTLMPSAAMSFRIRPDSPPDSTLTPGPHPLPLRI